ncbi:MAG TPA: hypothetical protein VHV30_08690, partial [Polyangiaceae bacterium]|nr:hypothetical protein [Polyangiaceae bacterium]
PLHSPAGFAYPDVPLNASVPYFTQAAPVPSQPAAPGKVKSTPRRASYTMHTFATYPYQTPRRESTSSTSQNSSHRSSFDDDENTREVCPIQDCGRSFKDLRAHMLTHQNERPEKCPIQTCEYHIKGFARKYDKNRHTLTHYKGTMVCGFCPGSGSGGEKTFNRADVFKRHLTSVHAVEQVAPNSRRKSPTLHGRTTLSVATSGPVMGLASRGGLASGVAPPTGRCSTCGGVFASAQDFYEHLDDCVLRVVQQIDPSEAINEMHLAAIAKDSDVRATLERHNLPVDDVPTATVVDDAAVKEEDEVDEDAEEDDEDDDDEYKDVMAKNPRSGKGTIKSTPSSSSSSSAPARGGGGGGSNWHSSHRVRKADLAGGRPGLTFSKGGVRSYAQHFAATAAAGGSGSSSSKNESSSTAAGASTSIATMSARKRRRHLYPAAWGSTAGGGGAAAADGSAGGARMKKRVLCVYDGRRRLCKDDMMLDSEFEVRVPLAASASSSAPPGLGHDGEDDGEAGGAGAGAKSPAAAAAASTAYVTDLDVQTVRRADAIFSATEEERGPWIPDNVLEMDLNDDLLA